MATILNAGDTIKGYRILRQLNTGAMAISYAAQAPGSEKAFLKQYKSPSVRVPWYRGYIDYQSEIHRIIAKSSIKNMVVNSIEMFEFNAGSKAYFQVFEFIEGGENMADFLAKIRKNPSETTFQKKIIFAKVIISSIRFLHEAGIIHCDLKPENLIMFPDPSIRAGYRMKLIDIDFSILATKRAPWHGHMGYIGTPGYLSPEHLTGKIPDKSSDVFTCGLILYELLSEKGHPFPFEEDSYGKAVLSGSAPRASFGKTSSEDPDSSAISDILKACLSPDAGRRPSAKDVLDVLNGHGLIKASPSSPRSSQRISLKSSTGVSIEIGIRTDIGRYLCRSMGPDSQYLDEVQFTIDRDDAGEWRVYPKPRTSNETLLNGRAVTAPLAIHEGDTIAVGREARHIAVMPLKVSFI